MQVLPLVHHVADRLWLPLANFLLYRPGRPVHRPLHEAGTKFNMERTEVS